MEKSDKTIDEKGLTKEEEYRLVKFFEILYEVDKRIKSENSNK